MYLERYLHTCPYLNFIFYDTKKNLIMETNTDVQIYEIINNEF